MNANEYQKLAMRTKSNNFTNKELMINAALGLAGEISEFLVCDSDEEKNELGDIFWYIALMCDTCNIPMDEMYNVSLVLEDKIKEGEEEIAKCMIVVVGNICDYIKKCYFQGHILNEEKIQEMLLILLKLLIDTLIIKGFKIEEIWQLNIDKLKKRYPDGFKAQDSVNRTE